MYSGMPHPLGTGASGRESSSMTPDPCNAATLMERIAPHLNQKSEQGRGAVLCLSVHTHTHIHTHTHTHMTNLSWAM